MELPTLLFRIKEYLNYRFRAVGPHSLHSPFVFQLYNETIKAATKGKLAPLEKLRGKLLKNDQLIEVANFKTGKVAMSTIASVAKSSLSTSRFSSFLALLVRFLQADSILETGTSLGLNSLYLASAKPGRLTTIEGSQVIASLARKIFEQHQAATIRLVNGNLYTLLEEEIVRIHPDFYFLDADHRSSSIVFCLDLILRHTPEAKCIVIHDIYWSDDMKALWDELQDDPRFPLTIDLFDAGLLFPSLEMEKQHFTLRF